jgi:hypothetical protein
MSFHRAGVYAINMGLDSDNVFRIGGWSAGANRLQMDMSGNLTMAGSVTATSFSSAGVGAGTAGLAWGDVGTYALVTTNADLTAQTWRSPGATISGSLIGAAQAYGKTSPAWATIGTSLSGTWRAMALFATPNTNRMHGLALRIS